MKPLVATSYNPYEWWYGHLCRAFMSETELRAFPVSTNQSPGYSWETPLRDLLRDDFAACQVFFGSVSTLHPDLLELPFLTTLWSDYFPDPGPQEDILKLYDVLFVSCHEGIDLWKSRGVEEVHWLPFAFDDLLETKIPETREVELAFVGAINLPIHAIRREYLGALVKRFRMNDFQRRYSQAEAGAVYAGAKMVVNITELRGFNMRNFEAMGQGALLLTQKTGYGIPEMFQDGVHLVVYDGIEDLVEKATYYLQHEEERMRIAEAGQKEILAKHTYRHRAQEFLRVAASYAGRRGIGRKRANAARGYANFYRHQRRVDKLVEVLCGRGLDLQQRAEVLLQTISCLGGLCRSGRTVNFH